MKFLVLSVIRNLGTKVAPTPLEVHPPFLPDTDINLKPPCSKTAIPNTLPPPILELPQIYLKKIP